MAQSSEGRVRDVCGRHPHEEFLEAMALRDDERTRRLARCVWDCAEAVPAVCCLWLRFPAGTTYAEASRRVLRRAAGAPLTAP